MEVGPALVHFTLSVVWKLDPKGPKPVVMQ